MEVLDARRALAVQPHYDDNDIGCGGTLRRMAVAGCALCYVTVTDDVAGVLDPDPSDERARRIVAQEQARAGQIIGVANQVRLDWPDASGLPHLELRDQLIDIIREVRPDVVLTVDPRLPDEAHTDHLVTAAAVGEAVLLSGLPRIRPGSDVGVGPFSPTGIAYYFTAAPNTYIDTSTVQPERHAALDCYRSQFTDDDLSTLHRGLDRRERHQAARLEGPEPITHAEALRVVHSAQLHVGLPRLT